MASSNIKLFDENKGNMLTDTEFDISTQRLNGLQTGIASSKLQNKAMYQASLVAYAIAQVMMQNGKNANDTDAVSAFVANLSGTMLQKVYDIATTEEAKAGVATGKWMSPALVKAAIDKTLSDNNFLQKSGGTMTGNLILNANPTENLGAATKQYVDGNAFVSKKVKLFDLVITPSNKNPSATLPIITQASDTLLPSGILYKIKMNGCKSSTSSDTLSIKYSYFIRGSEEFSERKFSSSSRRTDYESNSSIVIFDAVDSFGSWFATESGDLLVSDFLFKKALPAEQNDTTYTVYFCGSKVYVTLPYINQGSIRVEGYLVYLNA